MELTVPEAAARANRTQETIRRWIWAGRLRSRKVGNQHVIDEGDLERILAHGDAETWRSWFAQRAVFHQEIGEHARSALRDADVAQWIDEDRDRP